MSQLKRDGLSSWRHNLLVQQLVLAMMWGGFCMLLMEIRYEHRAALGEKWQSWIPLIYLLASLVLMPVGIIWIRKFGRHLLMALFAGLVVVGGLGFWFHADNKPIDKVTHLILTDLRVPGHLEQSDDDTSPPILAPLALVGLGAIGILVVFWKHPSEEEVSFHE